MYKVAPGLRSALAALLLLPTLAFADAKVPVVVLYFDNNTTTREYDVLQKGLADMLITDLSASEQLQVVEREKLESLVGELKLQKSKFFDAATARKVGQLVGARYAVTGAFAAFEPEVRLDVRLLEVETSKVVSSQSVRGAKDKFFDLEAELVQKFLGGLKATLPARGGEKPVGAADFKAAVVFSESLDASDQGDIKAASTKMASVVRDAPDFTLARSRYKQLLERLRNLGKKREGALSQEEKDLVAGMDKAIAQYAGRVLKGTEVETYFCYRAMRTAYLLWKLEQSVGPASGPLQFRAANKAQRAEAAQWVRAIYENETALIEDAIQNHGTLQYENHALSCPMALHRANSKDFYRLKPLGIPWYAMPGVHPGERTAQLVEFAVNGIYTRAHFDEDAEEYPQVRVLPTLITLEPAAGPKLLKMLEVAKKHLELPMSRSVEQETLKLEAARAGLLLRLERREEAIATLQSFLEKYPKSRAYKGVESMVEGLLGASELAKSQSDAIAACTADEKTMRQEFDRRFDADGAASAKELLSKIPDSCAARKKAVSVAVWNAAERGDCGTVKALATAADDAAARGLCE
jgi:TolB-like protein